MRKDAIGAYGGSSSSTPFIDNFANDAVVYRECVAPSPWTIPSHASFFTGEYPTRHGIYVTSEARCLALKRAMNNSRLETLPEYMQRQGYKTMGFSANYFVCPGSGFDRGFDVFKYTDVRGIKDNEREAIEALVKRHGFDRKRIAWDSISHGRVRELASLYLTYRRIKRRQESLSFPLVKGGNTILRNIHQIQQGQKEERAAEGRLLQDPLFLFANFMELHEPYTRYELDHWSCSLEDLFGLRSIPTLVLDEMREKYYAAAGRVDILFGSLIQNLKANNLYDDSLIIVLSDHGQAFKERNYYGHGVFLYDEIVEVPLIVKFPKNRKFPPRRGYQSLVDIPLLIKRVLEERIIVEDPLTRESAFSESFGIHQQFIPKGNGRKTYDANRKAVYKKGYKLVYNYTLERIEEFSYNKKPLDEKQMKNEADSLLEELNGLRSNTKVPASTRLPLEQEEELIVLERLRALGY